jgi:4-oxalocrotonate tautomerase
MPYVNVRITKEGVTAEQKRKVIKGITDVLVKELGKNPDTTFVVIDEVELDNWGHKGTSVAELRKKPAIAPAEVDAKVQKAPVKRGAAKK